MSSSSGAEKFLGGCIAIIALFLLIVFLGGLLFAFFWNITVPVVFGGPSIEWYHGVAIVGMGRMIFSNSTVKTE